MSNYTATKIENDGRQLFRVESGDGESFEVAVTNEGQLIDSDGIPMDYHPQAALILSACAEARCSLAAGGTPMTYQIVTRSNALSASALQCESANKARYGWVRLGTSRPGKARQGNG